MGKRFYLMMLATNSANTEREYTKFECYENLQDAVDMVEHWLGYICGFDLVPKEKEEELRAANGGDIPEMTFLCPEVKEPKDLIGYNGYYPYLGIGMCSIFLTPVYDHDSAMRFRAGMNKEYEIDKVYSDEADRLWELLKVFVASFDDDSIDPTEAYTAIRDFLLKGGFSLWETMPYSPDYMVLSGDMGNQFDRTL